MHRISMVEVVPSLDKKTILFLVPEGYEPNAHQHFLYLVIRLAQELSKMGANVLVGGYSEAAFLGKYELYNSLIIHELNELMKRAIYARAMRQMLTKFETHHFFHDIEKLKVDFIFIPILSSPPMGLAKATRKAGIEIMVWDSEGHPSLYDGKWGNLFERDNIVLLTMNKGLIPFIKQKTGKNDVYHFPYFCDPLDFFPIPGTSKRYDMSYTGNFKQTGVGALSSGMFDPTTKKTGFSIILDPLARAYEGRLNVFGQGYPTIPPYANCKVNSPIPWFDTNRVNNESKICLSIHSDDYRDSSLALNPRFFSILSSGSFLITDYVKDMEYWFDIGVDFKVSKSAEETIELANYYLAAHEERKKIAENGLKRVLSGHTSYHRAKLLAEIIRRYS
jgi:spore maturation protein CgeB